MKTKIKTTTKNQKKNLLLISFLFVLIWFLFFFFLLLFSSSRRPRDGRFWLGLNNLVPCLKSVVLSVASRRKARRKTLLCVWTPLHKNNNWHLTMVRKKEKEKQVWRKYLICFFVFCFFKKHIHKFNLSSSSNRWIDWSKWRWKWRWRKWKRFWKRFWLL